MLQSSFDSWDISRQMIFFDCDKNIEPQKCKDIIENQDS